MIMSKVCKTCKIAKPSTLEYFGKHKNAVDGLNGTCKECYGIKSKDRNIRIKNSIKIVTEFKICKKCKRELSCKVSYFPQDETYKDGFRSVCRECGADGHFMKDDYVPNERWTKEEDDLLISIYKDYMNSEIIEMFLPNKTKRAIESRAGNLGVSWKSKETLDRMNIHKSIITSGENSANYGKPMSEEQKQKISKSRIGKYVGENSPRYGIKLTQEQKEKISKSNKANGNWIGDKNPRHKNPLRGKNNGNWKGGITPLYFELRSETKDWQKLSMEACNYKCVITGKNFDQIHHLHPFRNIVDECFQILGLEQLTATADYSTEDFDAIKSMMNVLHEKYGYGQCLLESIHKLFHNNFGYSNNTPQQFEEFKQRLKSGEFDEFLKENNLKLII